MLASCLLVFPLVSEGATWQVLAPDPPVPDVIGGVVAQAADGDTILVGPGVYSEHVNLQGKAITLRSTDGPSVTVLDGATPPSPGGSGSIVYSGPFGAGTVVLSGFTLEHGTGGLNEIGFASGGAVCFWNHTWAQGGHAEITNCVVTDNSVPASGASPRGGGIYLDNLLTAVVSGCSFSGNQAMQGSGGALCLIHSQLTVEDCNFAVDRIFGRGAAMYISALAPVRIERCSFTSEGLSAEDWCVYGLIGDVHLIDNTFVARSGSLAARLVLYSMYSQGDDYTTVEVIGNRILAEGDSPDGSLHIQFGEGIANVTGNTLVNCTTAVLGAYSDTVDLSNNLLFHSPTRVASAWNGGNIRCNDAWPDSITDTGGNFVFDRNVAQDPLFCHLDQWSFDVSAASVCAAGNSPEGCGWIGAGRIGCNETAVRAATWGQIKALFR